MGDVPKCVCSAWIISGCWMDFIEFLLQFFYSLITSIIFLSLVFVYAKSIKRVDIIDSFWGVTVLLSVVSAFIISGNNRITSWAAVVLVAFWAFRLSKHVFSRFRRSKNTDARYDELIKKLPDHHMYLQIYLRFFVVQAFLATVVSLPGLALIYSPEYSVFWVYIGAAIWLAGFVIEIISDKQLAQFAKNTENHNQLIKSGLWRYSRHPNYFGEIVIWWGLCIMTIGSWYLVPAMIGAATITFIITKISGIPPSERQASKREGWLEYKHNTSVLIPWFRRV